MNKKLLLKLEDLKNMIPEKILGVYGGLGPAASAEFMRLLAAMAPAPAPEAPAGPTTEELLIEIRDLLKEKQQ